MLALRRVAEPGAPLLVVVNDRRELYPEILERAGLGSIGATAVT